jgi:hypothetical protein
VCVCMCVRACVGLRVARTCVSSIAEILFRPSYCAFFAYDFVKAIHIQAWTFVEGSRFHDNRNMKVARVSAIHTGLYPPR